MLAQLHLAYRIEVIFTEKVSDLVIIQIGKQTRTDVFFLKTGQLSEIEIFKPLQDSEILSRLAINCKDCFRDNFKINHGGKLDNEGRGNRNRERDAR